MLASPGMSPDKLIFSHPVLVKFHKLQVKEEFSWHLKNDMMKSIFVKTELIDKNNCYLKSDPSIQDYVNPTMEVERP